MLRRFAAVSFGVTFVAIFLVPAAPAQQVLDRIVAVVDDHIILSSDVSQYAQQLAIQLGINPENEAEKFQELRKNTLSNLVMHKVLLTKAKEDSLTVDERQVDQSLDDQVQRMVERLGSEEKLEEYFGQPLRKIRRTLRQEIAERLLVETLQTRKVREIRISRREVEEYYYASKDSLPTLTEAVHLSHILFTIEAGEDAQKAARARIDSMLQLVRSGHDFATLARKFSEDQGSAAKGGELGFIQRGDFIKEFEEAAFALKTNEVGEVVQSQLGFHIIQLLERRGEKINARHILIKLTTTADDEKAALQKAETCRQDLLAGKPSFAEAAKSFSQDKSTRDSGGDLGWLEVDELQLPAFKQVVRELASGEISRPVQTRFGYHLIRLNAKREPRPLNLAQDYEEIQSMALAAKREREFLAWVEQLKKQLYIRVNAEI